MAATIDFANLGTLSPEDYAEQQALSKKQRLAQALLTQGMQKAPQGQMVSGHYVAPSFFEGLNNVAQAAAGKYLENQGDQEALDYATRLRKRDSEEMATGLELWRGREGQAGDKKAAADFFMNARGSRAQALGNKLMEQEFKEPDWKETTMKMNGMEVKGQWDANRGMHTFQPYNYSPDTAIAESLHKGVKLPTVPQGGMAMPMGGSNPAPVGGVPVSVRNNNPGNMVGSNGQFQQFPTPQAGQDAMVNDLNLKLNGQSPAYKARFGDAPVTPLTLAETWSPANAKGNSPESTANYAKKIAQDLGINPNAPIPRDPATVGKLQQSMAQFEAGSYAPPKADKYQLQMPEFPSEQARLDYIKRSQEPLQGEAYKTVTGATGVIRASDKYINTLENNSREKILGDPATRAMMQSDTKNLLMFQKKAFELGVLNKEDIPQIEAVVRDPTNIQNILLAKPALIKLARMNQMFQRDTILENYHLSEKQMPPYLKNQLTRLDTMEEGWAKKKEEASTQKSNPNTANMANQGKPVAPKAQDISQIKTALGKDYNPSKEYKIVDGKILERDR